MNAIPGQSPCYRTAGFPSCESHTEGPVPHLISIKEGHIVNKEDGFFIAMALLGLLLVGWAVTDLATSFVFGADPRGTCERGVIGEQQLFQFQALFPDTQKGDFIIARDCWRGVVFTPSSAMGQPVKDTLLSSSSAFVRFLPDVRRFFRMKV